VTTDPAAVMRWALVVLTVFVLQIGVFTDLKVLGVHPDAMLLLAVCAGLAVGAVRGAEVGFAAGLLSDLLLHGALGTAALAFALVGFAVGVAGDAVLRSSRVISVGITAVASASGVLIYAALCLPALAVCRWAEGSALRAGLR
jgi:rod shape-determining protein MreD